MHLELGKIQRLCCLMQRREEELWAQRPGVNEVSFRARPHHSMHYTLGVDIGATSPHSVLRKLH
jgi:chloramphenicol 3-O-phosphotransferase